MNASPIASGSLTSASPFAVVASGTPALPIGEFTPDEVATLETAYRRIAIVPHEDGEYSYAFKPAEKLQWRAFRAAANDEDKRSDAQEQLIKQCVVAVVYKGERSTDVPTARALLDKLLSDYVSATDGREVSRLIFKVNGQAGARSGK